MMPGMRAQSLGLVVVLSVGCGDDGASGPSGTTGEASSSESGASTAGPGSSGSSGDTPTTSTTDAADSSSEGGFEPPMAECGNGFVEGDEECDDANDQNDDGCSSDCRLQCGLEWTALSLAPTDQSDLDARGVTVDGRGVTTVVGFLREVTTDQRGNETAMDDEALVMQIAADGTVAYEERLAPEAGGDIDVVGVVADADGSVYVAATATAAGGDSDIRLYKLDDSGQVLWSVEHDSAQDTAEDLAFGVALDGDGHPVVSGQVRAGEGDDDVWVASYDADNGDPRWSATWSGQANGGFSTDDGGPVTVAPDGTVYVFAREYVDFQNTRATVLAFDGVAPMGTSVFTPEVGGATVDTVPSDVAAAEDGSLLLTFVRQLPAGPEFYGVRVDPGSGEEQWRVDATTFAEASPVADTSEFVIVSVAPVDGGGVVVTGQHERAGDGTAWVESWVARFDDADALECMFVRESPQLSLVPGSLRANALATASSGRAIVAGVETDDGVESLWVGAFRPQ